MWLWQKARERTGSSFGRGQLCVLNHRPSDMTDWIKNSHYSFLLKLFFCFNSFEIGFNLWKYSHIYKTGILPIYAVTSCSDSWILWFSYTFATKLIIIINNKYQAFTICSICLPLCSRGDIFLCLVVTVLIYLSTL